MRSWTVLGVRPRLRRPHGSAWLDLVAAMETQLELAQAAREDAVRAERFTRIMAWSSLAVAVASLGAAVVAIVVSAQ